MSINLFNNFTKKITDQEVFFRDGFWKNRIPKVHPSPNILTSIRIIGAIFLIFVRLETAWFLVVIIFLFLTDYFDGVIARIKNEETQLGKWLDPVADKLLLISVIVFLYHISPVFWQSLLPIILFQEILILLLGILLLITKKPVTPVANLWGRSKFTLYCLGIIFFLFKLYLTAKTLILLAVLSGFFAIYYHFSKSYKTKND